MICKLYGIVDLLAAIVIFFGLYDIPFIIKVIMIIILLVKGLPSLAGDLMCRIYGIIDVIVAISLWFGFILPDFIRLFLVVVLFFKGVPSLFAH